MSQSSCGILAPSHLHPFTLSLHPFGHVLGLLSPYPQIFTFPGLPNFSPIVLATIQRFYTVHDSTTPFIWIVGDHRFGNYCSAVSSTPFLANAPPSRFYNVSSKHVVPDLDRHYFDLTLSAVDIVLAKFSGVKVIFWDLLFRTEVFKSYKKMSHDSSQLYRQVIAARQGRVIDVVAYASSNGIRLQDLVRDRGCHPSLAGLDAIFTLIHRCTQQNRSTTTEISQSQSQETTWLIQQRTSYIRFLALVIHACLRFVLKPLQNHFAIFRPRRKNMQRNDSWRLIVAYYLLVLYQFIAMCMTVFIIALEEAMALRCSASPKVCQTYVRAFFRDGAKGLWGWGDSWKGAPPILR